MSQLNQPSTGLAAVSKPAAGSSADGGMNNCFLQHVEMYVTKKWCKFRK
jgi:hypothetical protein